MKIDYRKLVQTYRSRERIRKGYTFVVNRWHTLSLKPLWDLFYALNQKIYKVSFGIYEPYVENLHSTIIGIENYQRLDEVQQRKIKNLFLEFPELYIESIRVFLRDNGLVVAEIYLDEISKTKLANYRKQFQQYEVMYKYPLKIDRMHSVLGIYNPQKLRRIYHKVKWKEVERSIASFNWKCINCKDKQIIIRQENTSFIHYRRTSLIGSHTCLI